MPPLITTSIATAVSRKGHGEEKEERINRQIIKTDRVGEDLFFSADLNDVEK